MSDVLEKIKAFGMTNQMLMEELHNLEKLFSIDLGLSQPSLKATEEIYYPQFEAAVRSEAASMSKHYETFYNLEKTIRSVVGDTIEEAEKTTQWWQSARVPSAISSEVASRRQRELDSGMTPRSDDELDYTTFGELGF